VTIIFSVGAMIGRMITMFAAVANRTAEIGTLRALGFRRRNSWRRSWSSRSCSRSSADSPGVALASLMSFVDISTVNFGTFSELAFGFVMSPGIAFSSLVFAVAMGLLGGFLPSAVRRASVSCQHSARFEAGIGLSHRDPGPEF